MYKLFVSNQFSKDLKLARKRGFDITILKGIDSKLQNAEKLQKHAISTNLLPVDDVVVNCMSRFRKAYSNFYYLLIPGDKRRCIVFLFYLSYRG